MVLDYIALGILVFVVLVMFFDILPNLSASRHRRGFPLLGDSCSRSTGFLLHRAA